MMLLDKVRLPIICFIFSSCFLFSCRQTENVANDSPNIAPLNMTTRLDKGKWLLESKKFNLALLEFDSAIVENPHIAVFYEFRGLAKVEVGDFKGAISDLRASIALNPDNFSLIYEKANIEYQESLLDSSIIDYTNVILKDSTFADAFLNRGLAKLKKGDKVGGCIDFHQASRLGNLNAVDLIKENCKK